MRGSTEKKDQQNILSSVLPKENQSSQHKPLKYLKTLDWIDINTKYVYATHWNVELFDNFRVLLRNSTLILHANN